MTEIMLCSFRCRERNVGRVGEESGGREGRSQVVHRPVESEDLDIMPAIYSSARLSVSLLYALALYFSIAVSMYLP